MEKSIAIGLTIIGILLVVLIGTVYYVGAQQKNSVTGGFSETNPLNVFEGKITNTKVSPGKITGLTTYDSNCVGSQLTQCDAGIKTAEYGVLNFHYQHDMAVQPCLDMFGPEKVIVDILDSDGNARITRTITIPNGMMHHG